MAATTLPLACASAAIPLRSRSHVALVGNPNTGKTTLFNRLTGLRARTANFPGTTLERRVGSASVAGRKLEVEDLPGLYGLGAVNVEERVARDALRAAGAALVVVDATNLARNLYLVGQVRELGLPLLVVLNMKDLAAQEGLSIDEAALSRELGAPVVSISARTGEGIDRLQEALDTLLRESTPPPAPEPLAACTSCSGCSPHSRRFDWAEGVALRVSRGTPRLSSARTAQIDRVLTHPVKGLAVFASIMALVFVAIFTLAEIPMNAIEAAVAAFGTFVGSRLPEGDFNSLVVDGVIGGVGGVLVFLPQICILFFFLSILEDSGYLARAAFVMDRLMGKVGLPGKAFVPMLSAHACAVPAIMSTRVIEDRRDRLASILVLPLMTCSARLPVYAMIVALLLAGRPVLGGLLFAAAYALGIVAALSMAWIFRKSLLPGKTRPLVLELPTYKMPSLRNALLTVGDRAQVFLAKAGTVILLVSITLWALATYPKAPEERLAGLDETARSAAQMEYALAGRIGHLMEPAFRPLGFDWRINVGVLSSFAARETLVSTLAIVYGVGEDAAEDAAGLRDTLRAQKRADGSAVYDVPTACALLVFFVLAMQCLPTQAITRRETGSWKWAAFQFAYMTVLAYTAALITYQSLRLLTA
jgi:ferrous iron transport protein B